MCPPDILTLLTVNQAYNDGESPAKERENQDKHTTHRTYMPQFDLKRWHFIFS